MNQLSRILRYLSDKNETFALGVFDADKREQANNFADEYYAAGVLVLEIAEREFHLTPSDFMAVAYTE